MCTPDSWALGVRACPRCAWFQERISVTNSTYTFERIVGTASTVRNECVWSSMLIHTLYGTVWQTILFIIAWIVPCVSAAMLEVFCFVRAGGSPLLEGVTTIVYAPLSICISATHVSIGRKEDGLVRRHINSRTRHVSRFRVCRRGTDLIGPNVWSMGTSGTALPCWCPLRIDKCFFPLFVFALVADRLDDRAVLDRRVYCIVITSDIRALLVRWVACTCRIKVLHATMPDLSEVWARSIRAELIS